MSQLIILELHTEFYFGNFSNGTPCSNVLQVFLFSQVKTVQELLQQRMYPKYNNTVYCKEVCVFFWQTKKSQENTKDTYEESFISSHQESEKKKGESFFLMNTTKLHPLPKIQFHVIVWLRKQQGSTNSKDGTVSRNILRFAFSRL